ncbi:MAG: DUF4160 domain-containing protein [Candidatus Eisenbacteria bacterium]|uniref:DUF4160 domain-containing protein n=1 Tax=Eiseniibacteriota bacterium TaxID=2212470 RepID=A0A933W3I8_UNCEI|nr:DUF4160 domain-containing protein [Candidatus Eisenbacteria bacterium]
MSPTIFRAGELRFFFFSREEPRLHVHVEGQGGEAKFWIAPRLELAGNRGLSAPALARARRLIRKHESQIREAWRAHFGA